MLKKQFLQPCKMQQLGSKRTFGGSMLLAVENFEGNNHHFEMDM